MGVPEETLFIALTSGNRDGHRYVKHALEKGVGAVLVSNQSDAANGVLVDDTLHALQEVASFVRSGWTMPVVGITGSNGKTIVKEWLSEVLSRKFHVTKSPKSYNSQIGVALSILSADEKADVVIIEAGISQPDEMVYLEKMIRPNIAVLTNFGDAHADYFPSKENHLTEKMVLFKNVQKAILPPLPRHLKSVALEKLKHLSSNNLYAWDTHDAPIQYIVAGDLQLQWSGNRFQISAPDDAAMNCYNLITVISTLIALGEEPADFVRELESLDSVEMRLKRREGLNDCVLIEDYYNSDLTSLQEALKFLGQIRKPERKIVILTDMDSGMDHVDWLSKVTSQLAEAGVDELIGIGASISRVGKDLPVGDKQFFLRTEECLHYLKVNPPQHAVVLLKGARKFRLEEIASFLSRKQHRTKLEVNLTALRNNLNLFRSRLSESVKVMGMVKAVSYGAGSVEVATALESYGVDYLAVAYADEGVQIRLAGVRTPIMVMNAGPADTLNLIEHTLEPVIYSADQLAGYMNQLPDDVALGVHLELDTGMHRLGLNEEEVALVSNRLKQFERLKVESVFSHLAAADDSEQDHFTKQQIDGFKRIAKDLEGAIGYRVSKHICNTAGILRFESGHLDMVRLGLGLYGVNPVDSIALQLVPSLKSVVSQIRVVPAGEGVSYGLGGKADAERTIAVIPIGYADGFDRRFSDGVGFVWIKGTKAHVVGKVCMDMVMVDISGLEVESGDEVVVFETEMQLKELSETIGVIPYELLSGVSSRVARDYFTE